MVKGTNDTEMVRGGVVARDAMATVGNNMYLTTKDKLWEVNFDSQYKLYEGLTLAFELGCVSISMPIRSSGMIYTRKTISRQLLA